MSRISRKIKQLAVLENKLEEKTIRLAKQELDDEEVNKKVSCSYLALVLYINGWLRSLKQTVQLLPWLENKIKI